jgi:hypothetical protein
MRMPIFWQIIMIPGSRKCEAESTKYVDSEKLATKGK